MRLAINQPYFIPYAGYFRLFAACDLFVIYDDCQFPYPGWCHRNQLINRRGERDWLTIPLRKKPLSTEVRHIEFAQNCDEKWRKARGHFPLFDQRPLSHMLQTVALGMSFENPLKFILTTLDMALDKLDIDCAKIKSGKHARSWNQFNHGQDRVIEICKKFKATEYINASGGDKLYDPAEFEKHGIKLKILKPYQGSSLSILERLHTEDPAAIRKEIMDGLEFIS